MLFQNTLKHQTTLLKFRFSTPFRLLLLLILSLIFCGTGNAPAGAQTRKLIWSDEFNGSAGSAVDSSKWSFEIGGTGWGNSELEYYTSSPLNSSMDGNGNLVITALQQNIPRRTCWYGLCQYTSARIHTKGKFEQLYGRFEARIKVPYGQGIWPAFWMLGNNRGTVSWPNYGEIDVMEQIGREPSKSYGYMHGPGYSGSTGLGAFYKLPSGVYSSDFHVYAVEWEPNAIRWYVDGNLFQTRTPADLPPGGTWVFDHPFFMVLNVAVGGVWPGNPDATSTFPQKMYVDYVRVYQ